MRSRNEQDRSVRATVDEAGKVKYRRTAGAKRRKGHNISLAKKAVYGASALVTGLAVRGGIDTYHDIKNIYEKTRNVLNLDSKPPSADAFDKQIKSPESPVTMVDIVYPWLEGKEREDVYHLIQQARDDINRNVSIEHLEDIRNIYYPMIRTAAEKWGIPGDLLLGLVIAESGGNPRANSGVAKGLTQMSDKMAKKYNMEIGDDDDKDERITNPQKVLDATAQELSEAFGRYGNWGYPLAEWHMGMPNLATLAEIYFNHDLNVTVYNFEELKAEATREAEVKVSLNKLRISQNHVNIFRLLSNPRVQAIISSPDFDWNYTDKYAPTVLAGIDRYYQFILEER